jgi:hypothetical protein
VLLLLFGLFVRAFCAIGEARDLLVSFDAIPILCSVMSEWWDQEDELNEVCSLLAALAQDSGL